MKLVLASASPRRAEILRGLGYSIQVDPPEIEEGVVSGEGAAKYVERLARDKAMAVARRHPGAWVVGGDTAVTLGEDILGKPRDADEAVEMLLRLAGRTHRVLSGLALVAPQGANEGMTTRKCRSGAEVTAVTFRAFGRATAEEYAQTREPMDKAGGYGIQGLGAALVERIEGDYSGVVGLPVPLLLRLLDEAGVSYRFPATGS